MKYQLIDHHRPLHALCDRLSSADWIAFDTEFVSEHSYVPQLCLIQIATADETAIIDPIKLRNVGPFWEVLVQGEHETIVHAGREELNFCYRATKRTPRRWFDVQLASGFLAVDYPAAYSRVVQRWLGRDIPKGETRTDWRRRPLTESQFEYAANDVVHLAALRDVLAARLDESDRREWFDEEIKKTLAAVGPKAEHGWQRMQGATSMNDRAWQILRGIWEWREDQAESRNCAPRRILRDDLVLEIARRGHTDAKRIVAVRGIPAYLTARADEMAQWIGQSLQRPLPPRDRSQESNGPDMLELLTQFLAVLLGIRCRQKSIATMLVGRAQDLKDLILYQLSQNGGEKPALLNGWRAEIVGNDLAKLLHGELSLRIVDPHAAMPIEAEP